MTDAAGFQNAFDTAETNGQDDIIYLAAGTCQGNFAFHTTDARSLVIKAEPGSSAQNTIFDGGNSGSALKIEGSAGCRNVDDAPVSGTHELKVTNGVDSATVNFDVD